MGWRLNRDDRVVALAWAAFGLAAMLSYSLQRLLAFWQGEPDASAIIASAHTAYYWRVALALVHGLVAGLGALFVVSPQRAVRLVDASPPVVGLLTLGCVLAMLWVP